MDLQQEIDARRAEIRSDAYSMSIGEMISLYENKEVDIHPEFQRFYRWNVWQKSRLIESLLLGIPIPPIFVSQRSDGVWDVVDGLQRLSTIFEFVGILTDENGNVKPPLVLEGTKYLPALKGAVWDSSSPHEQETLQSTHIVLVEGENVQVKTLTQAQRLIIRRAKIQVSIILKESDERSKYDLFQRLNTGGSSLSSQELRNCILVSININMYRWLRQLSRNENFTTCISLTDRAIEEQYDVELVLRFLVFRNLESKVVRNIGDLDEFLTTRMEEMASSEQFDMQKEEMYFNETFELLARTLQRDSFRRYDAVKGRFLGGFLVSAFEAVALGIGYNLDLTGRQQIDMGKVEEKVKQLWQMREFTERVGSGISASARIAKTLPLCREFFKP